MNYNGSQLSEGVLDFFKKAFGKKINPQHEYAKICIALESFLGNLDELLLQKHGEYINQALERKDFNDMYNWELFSGKLCTNLTSVSGIKNSKEENFLWVCFHSDLMCKVSMLVNYAITHKIAKYTQYELKDLYQKIILNYYEARKEMEQLELAE